MAKDQPGAPDADTAPATTESLPSKQDGRFVKGQSGNPSGRPRGRRNKITKLTEKLEVAVRKQVDPQHVINVLNELYIEAVAGNIAAAKTFLDYTLSKPTVQKDEQGETDKAPTIRIVVENFTRGAPGEKPVEGITIDQSEDS
jgi:hypothetical protein